MFGYKAFPSSPLLTGQQFGAYISICIFALWAGRKHLKEAFFAIYYALSISATRIRAEIGFPVVDMDYMGPFNSMVSIVGTRSFPPRSLTKMVGECTIFGSAFF